MNSRKCLRQILAGLVLAAIAGSGIASADVLITKSGSQFDGAVRPEADGYVLITPTGGKMRFPQSMVADIIKTPVAGPAAPSSPDIPPAPARVTPPAPVATVSGTSAGAARETPEPSSLLPMFASAELDRAMVAAAMAEEWSEGRDAFNSAAARGNLMIYRRVSAVPRARDMTLKIGRQTCQIRHNWGWLVSMAIGGRPECSRPGEGVLVKAVTALPLPGRMIEAGTYLFHRRRGWEIVTAEEAAQRMDELAAPVAAGLRTPGADPSQDRSKMADAGREILGQASAAAPDARHASRKK